MTAVIVSTCGLAWFAAILCKRMADLKRSEIFVNCASLELPCFDGTCRARDRRRDRRTSKRRPTLRPFFLSLSFFEIWSNFNKLKTPEQAYCDHIGWLQNKLIIKNVLMGRGWCYFSRLNETEAVKLLVDRYWEVMSDISLALIGVSNHSVTPQWQ